MRTDRLARCGVTAVFNVVGAEGVPGDGYSLLDRAIDDCMRAGNECFARQAEAIQQQMLLEPMIGSFNATG